jgi:hypothetical protein
MMNLRILLACIVIVACAPFNAQGENPNSASWLVGFWRVTAPQAKDIFGVVMEFRGDGSYILYEEDCYPSNEPSEISYRVFGDEVQAQSRPAGEKSRTLVFHASRDRATLSATFPEDGMVATLERIPENKCVAQS